MKKEYTAVRVGNTADKYNVYLKDSWLPPRVVKRGVKAVSRQHAIQQVESKS